MLRAWLTLLVLSLGVFLIVPTPAVAGFTYGDNTGLAIRLGDPLYNMLAKAANDLKAVNPQAGQGIEDMLVRYQLNRGVGEDADKVGGLTLPDGRAGTAGDRINISENWLNGGGRIDSSEPSTWTGSCWNQLLGVLAHEWVHANHQGMPIYGVPTPLADFLWEAPAMLKEMQVLEALGEPTGTYPVTIFIGGMPLQIPVKTRHEYIKQKLEEKRKKALEQLRKWLEGVCQEELARDATDGYFIAGLGESGEATLMEWCAEGDVLWGSTATYDGGYRYDLPMDDSCDLRAVPDLPLGSGHAVAFIAGVAGEAGVVAGLELSGREVVGAPLLLSLPGVVPESLSYRESDHSLWILDSAGQQIMVVSDTDSDGIPDALVPTPYATATQWPQLAQAREITARLAPPLVGVARAGFLPTDVFPLTQELTFLLDSDTDGVADEAETSAYHRFIAYAPAIVDEPAGGAMECELFGVPGALVTLGACDEEGSPSGEVLAMGPLGPEGYAVFPLLRPLLVGEHLRAYDPVHDPAGEAAVYQVPPSGANRPPRPEFVQLQVLTQTCPSGAAVALDASGSSDPEGDDLSFTWQELVEAYSDPRPLGAGAILDVWLGQGMHLIRLIVSDGEHEVWAYAGVGVAPPTATFSDVPGTGYDDDGTGTHWAFWEVEAVAGADIAGGYPDGSYRPALAVTRDQMATYIARALAGGDASVPTGPAVPSFGDVGLDHWAYDYVEYAVGEGVVAGYDDDTYRPTEPVDRGQMAVYIARALCGGEAGVPDPGCTDPVFPDVPCDFWARKHIQYIKDEGVTSGYPDGGYHPDDTVTRDQMAVYVARAFELPL